MSETEFLVLPPLLERAVADLLEATCRSELSLATAESCTGGLLASLLTDVEGSGHAFDRGFVVYTDTAKSELLGIDPELIADKGAVSREVAVAMAEGAIARSEADVAVAITGFAGPAGDGDEEGLVHFAALRRGEAARHRECHFGEIGRGPVRLRCLETAVAMFSEAVG